MKYILLGLMLTIVACSQSASTNSKVIVATCKLNNFEQLPSKIVGVVSAELGGSLIVLVANRDKTQSVEFVIKKKFCEVK